MSTTGSFQDTYYTSGEFFNYSSGGADANYKVTELVRALSLVPKIKLGPGSRIADVGCGAGETTRQLAASFPGAQVDGYDIHPQMDSLTPSEHVKFFHADFCTLETDTPYDLAVLFDVIEHVPDPITFMRSVAARSRVVALHIPLDDSWFSGVRSLARANLEHPGHLVVLNPATALTLVTLSGMRARAFTYSPVFRAPTGRISRGQRLLNPLRELLFRLSPYLAQRTLGGVSLMLVADTSLGLDG